MGFSILLQTAIKDLEGKISFTPRQINEQWISPVHLDSAINSSADDFGLVTDSTLEKGIFFDKQTENR